MGGILTRGKCRLKDLPRYFPNARIEQLFARHIIIFLSAKLPDANSRSLITLESVNEPYSFLSKLLFGFDSSVECF